MRRAALAALVVLGAAGRARAAAVLDVTAERCPDVDTGRLRELLVIELETVQPGAGVDVHLVCDGARVAVEARDRSRGRVLRADVDLAATPPETRLRLLALAVTEQWARERDAPPAAPAAPTNALVVTRAPIPAPAPPAWRLRALATLRRAGHPGAWLAGGGVGVERAFGRHLALALDTAFEGGDVETAAARVAVRGALATAALPVGVGAGPWSASLAPAFAVGLVSLSATPHAADARGASLDAAWAGPLAAARARRAIGRAGFIVADAAVGYTTRRVTGLVDGQTTLFALDGAWLTFGLGAGLTF